MCSSTILVPIGNSASVSLSAAGGSLLLFPAALLVDMVLMRIHLDVELAEVSKNSEVVRV